MESSNLSFLQTLEPVKCYLTPQSACKRCLLHIFAEIIGFTCISKESNNVVPDQTAPTGET